MQTSIDNPVEILQRKGVRIPSPAGIEIGPEVRLDRISGERVTLHAGCRIFGSKTLILPGVELGYEAPVTIKDCQLGVNVQIKGGFFEGSCFLAGAAAGSGAQVRSGCLLEEKARLAHCVGLKQTILFPFVTLGSLINFCDCLMAGGTDEKNHSEVGSSYIHFNYTPNQDKATASLAGDVPHGVMLNQPPIFLGGQGGLVGPLTIAYGTVAAAGNILRKDVLKENTLILGQKPVPRQVAHHPGLYSQLKRIIQLNLLYIGNLAALRQWYRVVRARFVDSGTMQGDLHSAAIDTLSNAIQERIKRLGEVAQKLPRSMALIEQAGSGMELPKAWHQQREFHARWPEISGTFDQTLDYEGNPAPRDAFLHELEKAAGRHGRDYLNTIRGLDQASRGSGTRWLQEIVDHPVKIAMQMLPFTNGKGAAS